MKKQRIIVIVMICVCFITLFNGTTVYAAMSDEAENYEMGEYFDGTITSPSPWYTTYKYYKIRVTEKSHVSLEVTADSLTNFTANIYNKSGKVVLKDEDLRYSENATTGKSKASIYRVLPKGTYYLAFSKGGTGISTSYKFRVQAEKQISLPKGVMTSLKSNKKGQMTIKYKSASNAIGYRIQYATNEKFTKNKKTIYVASTSKTISGLKKGSRYYVKVCPYTVYDDGTRVFGQNSFVKTVIIKKK